MSFARSLIALAVLAFALVPNAAVADAGDPITVKVNMARILKINAPAATVIIGNPASPTSPSRIRNNFILTGKSYGETNLIILDGHGNAIADTMVSVVQAQGDLLTVFQGNARTTMACQPVCQSTITMGDDAAFSSGALASATLVQGSASGPK